MSPGEAHAMLDLSPPFTREQLEAAYHHALSFWHPSHFAEDEAGLAEAMDQTIRINEAYQFLTCEPEAEKPPQAALAALSTPTPLPLAEPKVEQVPPRILGPRLRLPKPDSALARPSTFTRVQGSSQSSSGSLSPRTPPIRPELSRTAPAPPPPFPRPPKTVPQPSRKALPWLIGIGGVLAVMFVWSFTQAGWSSRASQRSAAQGAGDGTSRSGRPVAPPRHPRLSPQMESLYVKATVENNVEAQRRMGDNFKYSSSFLASERGQSTAWYHMAANQGDPDAQREMGDAYRHGLGVTPDLSEALNWYRKAASNGDQKADTALRELQP